MSCKRKNDGCGCAHRKGREEEKSKAPPKVEITAEQVVTYMLTHGNDFKFQKEQPKLEDMMLFCFLAVVFGIFAILAAQGEGKKNNNFGDFVAVGVCFFFTAGLALGNLVQLVKTYYHSHCNAMKAMIEACEQEHNKQVQTTAAASSSSSSSTDTTDAHAANAPAPTATAAATATTTTTATADAVVHCMCVPPHVAKEVTIEKREGNPYGGMSFYACPMTMDENHCRFFKWKHSDDGGSAPRRPAATADADTDAADAEYDGCCSAQVEIISDKSTISTCAHCSYH